MTFEMEKDPALPQKDSPLPRFGANDPTNTQPHIDIFDLVEAIRVQPFGGIAFIQDSGFTLNKVLALSPITPDGLSQLERLIEEKTSLRRAYGTQDLFIAIPNREKAIERGKRDFLYVLLSLLSMNGKKVQIGIRGPNVS